LKWVALQPILRRLFGNSFLPYHDYGRGGRGWRDLWQDCLALLLMESDRVGDLLLANNAGVRIDGSNATIIGAQPGEFIADRNNIPRIWMDHGAWPYLTTRLYIDQSGDLAFLLKEQTYFKDQYIDRARGADVEWQPEQGTRLRTSSGAIYRGTVLEHLLVQHLTPFFNVGASGNNIKLEDADWNDGLDMASQRGESVAFTALYASNLRDLSRLLLELDKQGTASIALASELMLLLDTLTDPVCYDTVAEKQQRLHDYLATCRHTISGEKTRVAPHDLANDLAAKADWLFDHLRTREWIRNREGYEWFNGYYDDDGERVEGDHPQGVRMTLTGQVFALMGGIASDEQAQSILCAVQRYLFDPKVGGPRLNTDFGEVKHNLGRCYGFAYGTKENGAMFSHMAVMYANALYRRGLVREGYQVLDGIYRHCRNFAVSRMYPGIPEYLDAQGRGVYPYLTGSASWLLLTMLTEAYGVKGLLGGLVFEPKLVREQFDAMGDATVFTRFAGRPLEVTYHNPARLDHAAYHIQSVHVDGAPVEFRRSGRAGLIARDVIAALSSHQAHRVEVTLDS
jgi:cellobiose phosphorylase